MRGLGLVQALMCDVRFAGAGVKLTTAFARRGIMAEHGIAWMLPRLVGPAPRWTCSSPPAWSFAEEAQELGLVNRVLPRDRLLDASARLRARAGSELLAQSMATMKRQVYADLQRELPDALADADRLMLESFAAPDFAEGVTSFIERRDPRFAALGQG